MSDAVLRVLFRCPHRQLTRPFTSTERGSPRGTYVVCLDCGTKLAYDWQHMRLRSRPVLHSAWEAAAQSRPEV